MFTRTTSWLRWTVVLGVAAVAMAAGPFAAPADAAIGPVSATLNVGREYTPGSRYVRVDGVVRMTPGEAQGLVDSGHRIVIRVWGEDPSFDDLLYGPYNTARAGSPGASVDKYGIFSAYPPGGGLVFHLGIAAKTTELDEDDSVLDDHDELYAGIRLVNSDGKTIRSGETRRVFGHF